MCTCMHSAVMCLCNSTNTHQLHCLFQTSQQAAAIILSKFGKLGINVDQIVYNEIMCIFGESHDQTHFICIVLGHNKVSS